MLGAIDISFALGVVLVRAHSIADATRRLSVVSDSDPLREQIMN